MKKVLAICLKTYLDEEDLESFLNGGLKNITDIKVYYKDKEYMVVENHFSKEYYKLVETRT